MNISTHEQGSFEWLEERYRHVTGTTSKGLFVKSDTLLIDLVSQNLEDFEEESVFVSEAMERGNELEEPARIELIKYTGIEFVEFGFAESIEIPLLGISPDGFSVDFKYGCEIKCPSRKKHTETIISDEIPLDNLHQLLHYFTVNPKLEKLFFCSFRPENKIKPLFVKALTKDSVINLGTKARPKVSTVSEWVDIAKKSAKELTKDIDELIESLKF